MRNFTPAKIIEKATPATTFRSANWKKAKRISQERKEWEEAKKPFKILQFLKLNH
jgi:hypothetical protein